jgi:hypothetical protein
MRTLLDTPKQAKPALSRSGFPMTYIDELAKHREKLRKKKNKMHDRIERRRNAD